MARRTNASVTPVPGPPPPPPPRDPAVIEKSDPEWAANLRTLRRNWKWANFSQFFYTFAPLLNMPDITLADIEDDLARGTSLYLPRVMYRLLYTLSQDRKLSIDNWQTGLRKQYMKREPAANPIGPDPPASSRQTSTIPDELPDEETRDETAAPSGDAPESTENAAAEGAAEGEQESDRAFSPTEIAEADAAKTTGSRVASSAPALSVKRESSPAPQPEEMEESKDWTQLPMLTKLDSLHTVQEWQFHSQRVRQLMRSDDEWATWRIEPIGYDAKTNAYWLIGPDRLWFQRVPPKPPKGTKRKRAAAPKKKGPDPEAEYESERTQSPKRRRPAAQSLPTSAKPRPATGRASRSRAKADPEEPATPSGSKSTRAAKVQANKKLDAQAKELAEFQRQAAALERSRARGSASPTKHMPRGTRASARLRGATEKDGDEWQQIPDEWLREHAAPESPALPRPVKPNTRKGKGKQVAEELEDEEDETVQETDQLKTGLESDEGSSELTELSDAEDEPEVAAAAEDPPPQTNGKSRNGRQTRSSRVKGKAAQTFEVPAAMTPAEEDAPPEVAPEDKPELPADFVEWEAICVTLEEWEHIAERFEKANHYLEKALYKVLSQHLVPEITARLRESERRRQLEEAIVHRKRSSRIAHKVTEREEARIAAQRMAEEEEKMSRQKRLETRVKKEEAEREKREKAREQRRLEREEREKRAAAKEERAQRAEVEVEAAAEDSSTPSAPSRSRSHKKSRPAANGTHSSDSVQLSRVSTPSGVQSPDWILACEICGKSGVNLDDGQPMVSCGICHKWQHIPCHDMNDARAGRPKRNWNTQSFFCQACRSGRSNGLSYGMPHQQAYIPVHQPNPHHAGDPVVHLQKTGPSAFPYSQATQDPRHSQHHQENGIYAHEQYAPQKMATQSSSYMRHQQPGGITFAHYQPEQRMFSTSGAPQAQQRSYTPQQHASFNLQFPPHQYSQTGYASPAGYGGSRTPVPYQPHSSTPQPHAYESGSSSQVHGPGGTWNGDLAEYSTPSANATQVAADALTFMQGMGSNRSTWSQQPMAYAPALNGNGVAGQVSHSHPTPPDAFAPANHSQFS